MKNLLQHWRRKRTQDHTQTTIITANPAVDEKGKSVWKFPPPTLEITREVDPDETGSFEVLETPPPEAKKEDRGSFDPYNTGAFNKGKAWGGVKKR